MKFLYERDIQPIHVRAGDSLHVDINGEKVYSEVYAETEVIDTIRVFKVDGQLDDWDGVDGLKSGRIVVVGAKK